MPAISSDSPAPIAPHLGGRVSAPPSASISPANLSRRNGSKLCHHHWLPQEQKRQTLELSTSSAARRHRQPANCTHQSVSNSALPTRLLRPERLGANHPNWHPAKSPLRIYSPLNQRDKTANTARRKLRAAMMQRGGFILRQMDGAIKHPGLRHQVGAMEHAETLPSRRSRKNGCNAQLRAQSLG